MGQVQQGGVQVAISVMQFGQRYELAGQEFISDRDGVHVVLHAQDRPLINLRLSPEEAFAVARELADAAGKAHAHRQRGDGKHPFSGLTGLMDGTQD